LKTIEIINKWCVSAESRKLLDYQAHLWRIRDYLEGMKIPIGCSVLFIINNFTWNRDFYFLMGELPHGISELEVF
jgi:hypothetical protein